MGNAWAGLRAAAVAPLPLPRLLRGGWAPRLVADPGGGVAALRAAWESAEPAGGGAAAAAAVAPVGGVYDVDAGVAVAPLAAAAAPTAAAAAAAGGGREEEEEGDAAGGGGGVDDPDVLSVAVTPAEDTAIGRLADLVGGGGGGRERAIEAWLVCGRNEDLAANFLLDGGA